MSYPSLAYPILVAYNLRPTGLAETCPPDIKFPSNYKPETCVEKLPGEIAKFLDKKPPYYFTFNQVEIYDTASQQRKSFLNLALPAETSEPAASEPDKKGKGKKKGEAVKAVVSTVPVWRQMYDWLMDDAGYAWAWSAFPEETAVGGDPNKLAARQAVGERFFLGFNARDFLKLLGLECAINGLALPLDMWFGASSYRDARKCLIPSPHDAISLSAALTAWDLKSYLPFEPGQQPLKDLQILGELVSRMGFAEAQTAMRSHRNVPDEDVALTE